MSDLISRQAAIDAFLTELTKRERKNLLHTWSTVEVKYFITDMLEQLPSAQIEQRWISVTERLPEHEYGESTSVLTVDLFGIMRVTYFDGGNWCWPSGEALTTMRVAPITHWMPLPEPPKEGREDADS